MKRVFVLASVVVFVLFCLQLAMPITALVAKKKVIIGYFTDPDERDEDEIRARGGNVKYRYSIIPAIAAEVNEAALRAIRRNPNVKYVEPDYEVHIVQTFPNDLDPRLWGLHNTGQTGGTLNADIDAPEAWYIQTGSSSVVIAVIDTGVDYSHEDLADNIWTNHGEIAGNGTDDDGNGYVDDVYGWDFYNGDNDPMDDHSHGTHCSGTIAAVGNNGIGVVGVNWTARIMALKFLSAGGSGSTSDAIAAIQYATMMKQKGIPIIAMSNSWGGGGLSQSLGGAIAAADTAGILFVAAAGNDGADNDIYPHYPSSYDVPNVIAVAATDHNDNLASFSNYGATSVDLAAPGVSILSTTLNNSYSLLSGTSMATPHVSGVVGLVKAQFPSITHLEIKDRILGSVNPIPSLVGKMVTGGRLNAWNALDVDATPPAPVTDLTALGSTFNSVTLTWTATGDDGYERTASSYDIRYSTSLISDGDWVIATQVAGEPSPQPSGSTETFVVSGLDPSTTYYFRLKVKDNVGNESELSNVVTGNTTAGTVVFQDNMETSLGEWTTAGTPGLWQQSNNRWNSFNTAWYYGIEGQFNYATGAANNGTLTSPAIDLTTTAQAALTFYEWSQLESEANYDRTRVQVSANGTTWVTVFESHGTNNAWAGRTVDLTPYVGGNVYIRFWFDTIDAAYNNYEGWYIDDVTVLVASDTIPPAAPTGLTVSDPGIGGALDLSWSPNGEPDLAGYKVYYGTGSGVYGTPIDVGDVTSYRLTGLTNGTKYYIALTAYDTTDKESGYSSEASGTPTDVTPPAAPTDLVATAGDAQVSLDWAANEELDLASYNVYRSLTSGGPYDAPINITLVTVSNYTDTGLTNGTIYYYVVTAVDKSNNESDYSDEVNATPGSTTLTVIGGFDDKTKEPLDGKTSIVRASDDNWWQVEPGYYTSFQFSDVTIPVEAAITSVVIHVEHWEDGGFKGNLEWSVGTGWPTPGPEDVWDSNPDIPSHREEQTDSWNVTDSVGILGRLNAMELRIKNNSAKGKKTSVDYIYAQVNWGAPDITEPSAVTYLATSNPTANSIELTWTAPGDDGDTGTASQYDIRHSGSAITEGNWNDATQCTDEPSPSPAGTPESFTVTGLSPNTTYWFALKTADEVPNWSEMSNSPSGTTKDAATQPMHVSAIAMSLKYAGANVSAAATVTIVDASGAPVSEATVSGTWSVATTDEDSGVTDSSGQVALKSDRVREPSSGTMFTFTVDDVTKVGWYYDKTANFISPPSGSTDPLAAPALTTAYPTGLENTYPNPGNPETWIPFTLSEAEHVVIKIYNATGRLVRTLELGEKAPGAYVSKEKAAYWDGRNESGEKVTSGIYFYLMEAGSFRAMRKMIVLK